MPLEFESLSHGRIAFGFFNIETDLILLNQYFLFAGDFCNYISYITEKADEFFETTWEVFEVKPENTGNLMGAIHGIDHNGFIGEVYKLFPFPEYQEDFKQKPEGDQTRSEIETLILKYGKRVHIRFAINFKGDRVTIGEYILNHTTFQELIRYVWLGGLPRWKNHIRPEYVMSMKEKIAKSKNPLFYGCDLTA
ncbi:MAG: hypothetical protein HXY44_04890 [Syntrophaceae bacterium]|nr:hypothetical protein [Syntrophaceae bacterium]